MVALPVPTDGEMVKLVSSEVVRFGDAFVIVTNVTEFIRRVVSAANEKRDGIRSVESRMVEYYDADEDSGDVGRFRKRSQFAYQNEFRIVVEPGSIGPRNLCVGSLLDITSEVLPSSAALEPWRFALN